MQWHGAMVNTYPTAISEAPRCIWAELPSNVPILEPSVDKWTSSRDGQHQDIRPELWDEDNGGCSLNAYSNTRSLEGVEVEGIQHDNHRTAGPEGLYTTMRRMSRPNSTVQKSGQATM